MADLYGDLDTSVDGKSSVHLKKELQTLQEAHEKLRNEAATLQRLNKELSDQNTTLEKNISVLFVTAQTEIARKDKTIQELRDELQIVKSQALSSRSSYARNTPSHSRRDYH
ncbi:hypothetical protein AeMF1_004801 [Aphanomyces euteiches]|nr:hypothetical protein AeMF1_004801 [Aphanomyces euteiches]KAH9185642.1 hypothetical protein AeNC1_012389 [Aphanomyces euteiches]